MHLYTRSGVGMGHVEEDVVQHSPANFTGKLAVNLYLALCQVFVLNLFDS